MNGVNKGKKSDISELIAVRSRADSGQERCCLVYHNVSSGLNAGEPSDESHAVEFDIKSIYDIVPGTGVISTLIESPDFVIPISGEEYDAIMVYIGLLGGTDGKSAVILPDSALKIRILLMLILLRTENLIHKGSVGDGLNDLNYIDSIIKYIENHLTEKLTIDSISDKFYISRAKLIKDFKAVTDCTMKKCVVLCRIKNARGLLASGMKVREAAEKSGFTDIGYFSSVFTRYVGMSPSKYSESSCPCNKDSCQSD